MFLLREMSHILSYIGSKIEDPIDDLFGDYSEGTFTITLIVFNVAAAFLSIYFLVYGVQHSLKIAMLTVAAIYATMCVMFSILTIIMENVSSDVAYYTRAVVSSLLFMALVLAILACPLPITIS